ncbi:hypothetical protein PRIPAC_97884 [Pristionchus pacificus]|uniref:Uncharacterized protein n=1 Tax=Pristionchus pacificus TaxID=54126 RepID=A0A2A6D291_PRIPA|nr:hypothetical protein PRIPAC_97884 [Pristionchus pacificus]|eukprot:PDM84518.1 hypothetical protein PRIPAC_33541 [Pristionchus pacificus]
MNRLEIEREDPEKKKREGQGETIHSHVNVSFSTTSSDYVYVVISVRLFSNPSNFNSKTFWSLPLDYITLSDLSVLERSIIEWGVNKSSLREFSPLVAAPSETSTLSFITALSSFYQRE